MKTWTSLSAPMWLLLLFMFASVFSGCSWGEPVEFDTDFVQERGEPFPRLDFKTLNGEVEEFESVLGKVTLVNFFFPT